MSSNQKFQTEIISYKTFERISSKLAAINNEVRFTILEILKDYQKSSKDRDPLYSREINILLTAYNINITPQMLGQHLKILVQADLLEEVQVKKEVPNKVGKRNVKAYILKEDAVENLFLDINFFSDELVSFFKLYDVDSKFRDSGYCQLTVFNGADKGKVFKIPNDKCARIGRKANFSDDDSSDVLIMLDNAYKSVSKISKPHLKVFRRDDAWYVIDSQSLNGTFIGDYCVEKNAPVKLPSNSFLKLSKGIDGIVLYCSY